MKITHASKRRITRYNSSPVRASNGLTSKSVDFDRGSLYSVSVLKSPVLPLVFAVAVSLIYSPKAGAQASGYGSTNGASADPFGSAPGMNAQPSRPRANTNTPDAGDSEDTNDDTLYRLKTKDSLGAGSMSRDEGQLTARQLRREKMLKVESTKQLPTSGTDPKFQTNLLHSGVTSINDITQKANTEPKVIDEGDPRFKAKSLVFSPSTEEEPKKKESPGTKADASPSPSPSPTASAKPSNR